MGADIQGAGVSTWTSLKPWPPAISQHQCGSAVRLYLHKPSDGEREGERLAEADFPVLD